MCGLETEWKWFSVCCSHLSTVADVKETDCKLSLLNCIRSKASWGDTLGGTTEHWKGAVVLKWFGHRTTGEGLKCVGFSVSTTGVSRTQVCEEVALFLIMDFGGSCSFRFFIQSLHSDLLPVHFWPLSGIFFFFLPLPLPCCFYQY